MYWTQRSDALLIMEQRCAGVHALAMHATPLRIDAWMTCFRHAIQSDNGAGGARDIRCHVTLRKIDQATTYEQHQLLPQPLQLGEGYLRLPSVQRAAHLSEHGHIQ
jgi:hypothetical protein